MTEKKDGERALLTRLRLSGGAVTTTLSVLVSSPPSDTWRSDTSDTERVTSIAMALACRTAQTDRRNSSTVAQSSLPVEALEQTDWGSAVLLDVLDGELMPSVSADECLTRSHLRPI